MTITRNDDAIAANDDGLLARATLSTILIVAAVAALAVTSLLRSHDRATAQTPAVAAQAAPMAATIPMSVPLDSGDVGPFAFGYLVFDWDPRAPGGVPGFDTWPPTGQR